MKKIIIILTILILSSFIFGCSSESKYTYEEWEKIKALREKEGSEDYKPEEILDKDNEINDELYNYNQDLKDYNGYIEECRLVYDRHYEAIINLSDSFDGEQEDLDIKNSYAQLIIDEEEEWISELSDIDVPYFLINHNDYLLEFLNNNKLFYVYFLESNLDEANKFAQKADLAYEKSEDELIIVKGDFNKRAQGLGLLQPFPEI